MNGRGKFVSRQGGQPMGAWGAGTFENDVASDWLYQLENATDERPLVMGLVCEGGYPDESAVAASELLLAALSQQRMKLPALSRKWLKKAEGLKPQLTPLVPHAIAALRAVKKPASDIHLAWAAAAPKDYQRWRADIEDLLSQLETFRGNAGLGSPRLLKKLPQRYAQETPSDFDRKRFMLELQKFSEFAASKLSTEHSNLQIYTVVLSNESVHPPEKNSDHSKMSFLFVDTAERSQEYVAKWNAEAEAEIRSGIKNPLKKISGHANGPGHFVLNGYRSGLSWRHDNLPKYSDGLCFAIEQCLLESRSVFAKAFAKLNVHPDAEIGIVTGIAAYGRAIKIIGGAK